MDKKGVSSFEEVEMMTKFVSPEEQRKNREKAKADANQRALGELGRRGPTPTLTIKAPTKYNEPADVISLDERRKKQ